MRVVIPLEQCWHSVPGGTARSALDLAASLDELDDVDVVGLAARHALPPPPPWTPDVPIEHLPLPRRVLYETWHGLRWPRVESVTGPADVCHAVGGAVPATRMPLVFTVHDLAFRRYPEMFTRNGRRFFERALTLAARHAAQVQVPSLATRDDCLDAGIDADRLRVVPWGCVVGAPTPTDIARVRSHFELPERWVVAVGTLEPRKNLPRLLAAWRSLQRADEQLVLVGQVGWGDALDASSIPDNVTMTGFVDQSTRDALYAGAAASCYPSLFEGFGLPVLESMALGCPVVTSAGTATEELASGGAGILVDPTDTDAVAAGISSLLDDEELRAAVRRAGLARADEFSWSRTAHIAVDAYREVVHR